MYRLSLNELSLGRLLASIQKHECDEKQLRKSCLRRFGELDLDCLIRVEFQLTGHPFQVIECGWQQFDPQLPERYSLHGKCDLRDIRRVKILVAFRTDSSLVSTRREWIVFMGD